MKNYLQNCQIAENLCVNCNQVLHLIFHDYEIKCEECGMVYDEDRFTAQTSFLHDSDKNLIRGDKPYITQTKVGCFQDYSKTKSKINYNHLQKIQTIACSNQKQIRSNTLIGNFRDLNARYGFDFDLSILRSESEKIYQQLPVGSPDRNLETLSKIIYYYYARKQGVRITLNELSIEQSSGKILRHLWRMKKRVQTEQTNILKLTASEYHVFQGNLISKWCTEFNCGLEVFNDAMKFVSLATGKDEIKACAAFIVAARLHGKKKLQAYKLATSIGISQSCMYSRANSIAAAIGFTNYTTIRPMAVTPLPHTPVVEIVSPTIPIAPVQFVRPIYISIPTPTIAVADSVVFSTPVLKIMKSPFIKFIDQLNSKQISHSASSKKVPYLLSTINPSKKVSTYKGGVNTLLLACFLSNDNSSDFSQIKHLYPTSKAYFRTKTKFSTNSINPSIGPPTPSIHIHVEDRESG